MQKTSAIIFLLIFVLLRCPESAHAIYHEVGASLNAEIMDFEYGDRDRYYLNAGYKYYFSSLKNDDLPIDLLPFLLHPSNIYGILQGGQSDYESDRSSYKSDYEWGGIKIGGMGYLPSNTGLGGYLRYQTGKSDVTGSSNYDSDLAEFRFLLDQYLGDSNKIWFSLSHETIKYNYDGAPDGDTSSAWFRSGYSGAYGSKNRFFFSVKTGIGNHKDEDSGDPDSEWRLYNIGLSFGPAMRHFAIYFDIDYLNVDGEEGYAVDSDTLEFAIRPKIWFNQHFLLGFELSYKIRDYDSGEDKAWGFGTEFAARF